MISTAAAPPPLPPTATTTRNGSTKASHFTGIDSIHIIGMQELVIGLIALILVKDS